MNSSRLFAVTLTMAATLVLTGCAGSQSGSAYSRSQTRGEMHVRMGVVESVRNVTIEGTQSGVGAGAGAVDGGNDRLRAGAHGLHQVAGHAREIQQLDHRHLGERTDDLVHVTAGAEIAASAGDHNCLHSGVGVNQVAEQVAHLGVGFKRQRVLALRPIESDLAYAVLQRP